MSMFVDRLLIGDAIARRVTGVTYVDGLLITQGKTSVVRQNLIARTVKSCLMVLSVYPTVKHALTVQSTSVCAFFAHTALHAETQFETYRITQDRLFESDFDRFLELEGDR